MELKGKKEKGGHSADEVEEGSECTGFQQEVAFQDIG